MGIVPVFFLLIPNVLSPVGYFLPFPLFYTQNISFLWVFLPFSSFLYPKYFFSLGISSRFLSSIPKTFLFFGYFFHFPLFYTQNVSLLWVFLPFLPSPYPISFLLLGIPADFFSLYPKRLAPLHIQQHTINRFCFQLSHKKGMQK